MVKAESATIGGWHMEGEYSYLNRRAAEERLAAAQAVNAKARNAHLAMAEYFETRLRAADIKSPRSAVRLVRTTGGAAA